MLGTPCRLNSGLGEEPLVGNAREAATDAAEVAEPRSAALLEERGASAANSWDAVRQRYRARAGGIAGAGDVAAAHDAWNAPSTASASSPVATGSSDDASRPRRVVRNAYGDEVVAD